MSEVERWDRPDDDRLPAFSLPGLERHQPEGAIDRHRERGLDFTPEERVARRRNRRLMLGVVVPSILILVLALIASQVADDNQPRGPQITAPAGYQAIRDSYFAYVVPKSWANDPANTDSTGDVDTSGPSGWAGEHIAYKLSPPALGETPPVSLQAFGIPRPEPFVLTGGHAITVPGAAAAFEYTATRAGSYAVTAIDAWDARADVELWLMVDAPDAVSGRVVSSLRA